MSDGIRGLISRDGQVRRRALDELGRSLEYYIPPNLRPLASFLGEMTPTAAHERATLATRDLIAPDRTMGERLQSGADLALDTAGLAAFPVALGRLGRPAQEVSQELLLGMSVNPQAAARQADEVLALPPPERQALLPPPERIDPDTRGILSEILEGRMPTGFGTFEGDVTADTYLRYQNVRDGLRRGEYDDVLSEDELRASLRDLMDSQDSWDGWDLFGDPAKAEIIRARMEALRQRFPDVEGTPDPFAQTPFNFNDDLPDPDWIQGPADPDPMDFGHGPFFDANRNRTAALPDTAPAAWVPDANPYNNEELLGGRYVDVIQNPLSWRDQGIAGLYSTGARASEKLKQPTYSDPMQLRRELEARGAKPSELDWQMQALQDALDASGGRLTREQAQEVLKTAPGLQLQRTRAYSDFGPAGGQGFTSTVYTHPSVTSGPRAAVKHFNGNDWNPGSLEKGRLPPLFHTRAAQYDITTPTGEQANAHHVLEIQSDWAQHRQLLPSELGPEQRATMRRELDELERDFVSDNPSLNPADEDRMVLLREVLNEDMTRANFDARYPAPFVKNENDWIDAGVRQNLLDAVNSGSEWITFGNGLQAHQHVRMPLEPAKRFYDQQVPKSVERVLKKFAREAGIDAPKLVDVPFVDGQTVKGLQNTPELRQAIMELGLPGFRDGGMVTAAEALMSTTPPPAVPAPKTPTPKKQPAQPQYKIERVMDGNGKYHTRFVEQP